MQRPPNPFQPTLMIVPFIGYVPFLPFDSRIFFFRSLFLSIPLFATFSTFFRTIPPKPPLQQPPYGSNNLSAYSTQSTCSMMGRLRLLVDPSTPLPSTSIDEKLLALPTSGRKLTSPHHIAHTISPRCTLRITYHHM